MKKAHLIVESAGSGGTIEKDDSSNSADGTAVAKTAPLKKDCLLSCIAYIGPWRIGITIFIVGSLVNFLSFAFASQSLLASLGAVQFLSNIFFGKVILKEEPNWLTYLSTAIIISGMAITVAFSSHSSTEFDQAGLIALYDTTYITFLVLYFFFLACMEVLFWYYTKKMDEVKTATKIRVKILFDFLFKLMYIFNQGIVLPGAWILRPCCYSLVSASIGTQSVLQAKCIAELISYSGVKGHANQFLDYMIYLNIFFFFFGLQIWLYRLNKALMMFDGLVIIPVVQVFWTTSAIIQGGIYFKEFAGFSAGRMIAFIIGLLIIFFGVYLLACAATFKPKDTTVTGTEMQDATTVADRIKDMEDNNSPAPHLSRAADPSSSFRYSPSQSARNLQGKKSSIQDKIVGNFISALETSTFANTITPEIEPAPVVRRMSVQFERNVLNPLEKGLGLNPSPPLSPNTPSTRLLDEQSMPSPISEKPKSSLLNNQDDSSA